MTNNFTVLNPKEWIYSNEGNLHVVFSYDGN